jgi:hypothetical protein
VSVGWANVDARAPATVQEAVKGAARAVEVAGQTPGLGDVVAQVVASPAPAVVEKTLVQQIMEGLRTVRTLGAEAKAAWAELPPPMQEMLASGFRAGFQPQEEGPVRRVMVTEDVPERAAGSVPVEARPPRAEVAQAVRQEVQLLVERAPRDRLVDLALRVAPASAVASSLVLAEVVSAHREDLRGFLGVLSEEEFRKLAVGLVKVLPSEEVSALALARGVLQRELPSTVAAPVEVVALRKEAREAALLLDHGKVVKLAAEYGPDAFAGWSVDVAEVLDGKRVEFARLVGALRVEEMRALAVETVERAPAEKLKAWGPWLKSLQEAPALPVAGVPGGAPVPASAAAASDAKGASA